MAASFDHESTTDDVLEGVDLTGRVAVVTGGSGGIGEETARALASRGTRVVLASRDRAKLDAARRRIIDSGVDAEAVEVLVVDLASLDSVRAAAAELVDRHPDIDILVLNAGVMACPLARTADGFEMQFGTNHLGHFLFTVLVADSLRAGGPTRVVVLSSAGHRVSGILWDDPNFEQGGYHNFVAYGQAKTANALFALELDRRLASDGVHAFSVHPGVILTDLGRHLTPEDLEWMADQAKNQHEGVTSGDDGPADDAEDPDLQEKVMTSYRFKSPQQGAATSVWAATAPELADHGGAYLEDCGVAAHADGSPGSAGVQQWACDPAQAERLWSLSVELTGADIS